MDTRKLCLGLGAVAIIAGLLLAAFTPGGWFNQRTGASVDVPLLGTMQVQAEQSSVWPIVGYVLIGVGAVAVVVGYSLKSPSKESQASVG